jgi:RNA polymerase sigma factor (sigma-70 family)
LRDNILWTLELKRHKTSFAQYFTCVHPVEDSQLQSKELFEILVRENSRMLSVFLRAAGCDDQLIEDVWQETMIVAWEKLDTFDRSRPFGPWLRGIAARLLLANQRVGRRLTLIGDESALEYLSNELHRINQLSGDTLDEKLEALRDCVARLSDQDRQCIHLRFQQDLKPVAISDQVGVALETIKKRIARAKLRLQDCIEHKLRATSD